MNVWVVNASPLILLGKINQLHLLAKLASQVVIPHEVCLKSVPARRTIRRGCGWNRKGGSLRTGPRLST